MKAGKQIWKKAAAGLLFLALIWSGVCLWQTPASKAQAAGDDSREVAVIGSQDKYEWKYTKAFVGEKDAGVKIDGALSEEMWQNKQWLTHSENGVNIRYTATFTTKGLYIAAIAEDPRMQWNDTRTFLRNSSFRFYVVSNRAERYFCFDCLSFYVDEKTVPVHSRQGLRPGLFGQQIPMACRLSLLSFFPPGRI